MNINKFKPFFSIFWRAWFIAVLAVISATVFNHFRQNPLSWVWTPPPPPAQVIDTLDVFQGKLAQVDTILVDARPALFYRVSHIPGAISLPEAETESGDLVAWQEGWFQGLSQGLLTPPPIIIYCSDEKCRMADDLAKKMAEIGLVSSIFLPGFKAWVQAGLPLESGIASLPARSEVP